MIILDLSVRLQILFSVCVDWYSYLEFSLLCIFCTNSIYFDPLSQAQVVLGRPIFFHCFSPSVSHTHDVSPVMSVPLVTTLTLIPPLHHQHIRKRCPRPLESVSILYSPLRELLFSCSSLPVFTGPGNSSSNIFSILLQEKQNDAATHGINKSCISS